MDLIQTRRKYHLGIHSTCWRLKWSFSRRQYWLRDLLSLSRTIQERLLPSSLISSFSCEKDRFNVVQIVIRFTTTVFIWYTALSCKLVANYFQYIIIRAYIDRDWLVFPYGSGTLLLFWEILHERCTALHNGLGEDTFKTYRARCLSPVLYAAVSTKAVQVLK